MGTPSAERIKLCSIWADQSASDLKQCSLSKYAAARAIRKQTWVTVIAVSPARLAKRDLMMTANSRFTRLYFIPCFTRVTNSFHINAIVYCVLVKKLIYTQKIVLHCSRAGVKRSRVGKSWTCWKVKSETNSVHTKTIARLAPALSVWQQHNIQ